MLAIFPVLLYFFEFVTPQQTPSLRKVIRIGGLFVDDNSTYTPFVGYTGSIGALYLAIDKIRERHLLDDFDFNVTIRYDNCIEKEAVGGAFELIHDYNVDVIIGPTCSVPAIAVGVMASYYNLPHYIWGFTTANELAVVSRFPTVIIMTPNYFTLSLALLSVMKHFEWDQFAFIYTTVEDNQKCPIFAGDFKQAVSQNPSYTISYMAGMENITPEKTTATLEDMSTHARIIVVCLSNPENKRKFILTANDQNMFNDEYVYIFADLLDSGYEIGKTANRTIFVWEDQAEEPDGRDSDAYEAFKKTLMISDTSTYSVEEEDEEMSAIDNFTIQVSQKMREPVLNCTKCTVADKWKLAKYSPELHDAMIIYANVANLTLEENKNIRDGGWMFNRTAATYRGALGNVTIAGDGSRIPKFMVSGVSSDSKLDKLILIVMDNTGMNTTLSTLYSPEEEQNVVWNGRSRPKTVPLCGFTASDCPLSFLEKNQTYVILAASLIVLFVLVVVFLIITTVRSKQKERERLDALWKIPYYNLTKPSNRSTTQSFSSGVSGNQSKVIDSRKETDKMCYFYHGNDSLTGYKHSVVIRFTETANVEFRKMRQIEHDNLNRFVGISADSGLVYSLWRFCARGTLQEVITKGSLPMDGVFIQSMMMDIATGVNYIHESNMAVHGRLSSQYCVVDDRWQVKVSYYGMSCIKTFEQRTAEENLWTAPEILRGDVDDMGTIEGDVYSFAIIASELITKLPAWDLDNRKESSEEIIRLVAKSAANPFRPNIDSNEIADANHSLVEKNNCHWRKEKAVYNKYILENIPLWLPSIVDECTKHNKIYPNCYSEEFCCSRDGLIHLIHDCWSESPKHRPNMKMVKKLLTSMQRGKKLNLMDHVMNTLENYAASLEEEVEERMKELVAEKKKSDTLLYRLMPKQVADKLKAGQSVEPESYDLVTIFFSDVVSFTTLASKCTPMQVVALLNALYTFFDEVISRQDVYKVETIGDGYLCASGLPNRNGNEHIRAICDLSLELIIGLRKFRIPHLPNETLNIRVGIHTGPVVAGVVGLTMPRYCLFGDTVNTASRMESNGKAGHVHMSNDAKEFLVGTFNGYKTSCRGEVVIKGKGVMTTHWLCGKGDTRIMEVNDELQE